MEEILEPYLNGFALVLMLIIVFAGVYLLIFIHDIPYEIAKKRNHPHKEAIHAAGWVSLFLAHAIWPILWIWAYLYRGEEGHPGTIVVKHDDSTSISEAIEQKLQNENSQLKETIASLKKEINSLKENQSPNI